MKKNKYGSYIAAGLTAMAVLACSILLFFVFYQLKEIKSVFRDLLKILIPFIIGGVIAYLLSPICSWLKENLFNFFTQQMRITSAKKLSSGLAVLLSLLMAVGVIAGLVAMVLPQLITSITGLINSMPSYLEQVSDWMTTLNNDHPIPDFDYKLAFDKVSGSIQDFINGNLENISNLLLSGVLNVVQAAKDVLLGLFVAAYLLADKEHFMALAKKGTYSIFGAQRANSVMEWMRYIHKIFGGFILGKLMDSVIIGILCFVGASLLQLPYTLLVSVVIGVTNIIPFFGPFIGAIPCALLILLTDPIKCIYFVIFVLALQQFDGNILGPRILGNATGLSAFSVLFAILIFGGLFGFIGMVIGVPLFAVISSVVGKLVNSRLTKQSLSLKTRDYENLDYVDAESKHYVKRNDRNS